MRMLVCYYSLFVLFEVILIGIIREIVVDGVEYPMIGNTVQSFIRL